ncbi:CCR4-NOT transcription complex subunit 4-like isoform X2 [Babylonia areolata]|uniref:CCR4-NOT transcription complex subunit 4-like isoform X2 n=1 Tax=Babylonia areolata TaxID=304850 RepID=UPI003FD3DBA6
MSVGDDNNECPLCMELLEIDDINFFPCTCGYQICRFCWHRIRTDENGLCPACRKQYPEDPAEFKPLTDDEVQNIKKERKQKECQRKQKAAENRKHLANVRVVQKNLVFVVGLSPRLADPEVLKKQEYFGKFGKIHKVVINQSTSYAGSQGPSASAYVTYVRVEDALRAILQVNNVHVDGRTLKTSLGTTKYCSNFLKSSQCTKNDCMYLHELGEEAASFTKEEMQMGKHQEYEQKLIEQFQNSQNSTNNHVVNNRIQNSNKKSSLSATQQQQPMPQHSPPLTDTGPTNSNKPPRLMALGSHSEPFQSGASEAWPSLQPDSGQNGSSAVGPKSELLTNGSRSSSSNSLNRTNTPPIASTVSSKAVGNGRHRSTSENTSQMSDKIGSEVDSSSSDSPLTLPGSQTLPDSKAQPQSNSSLSPPVPIGPPTSHSHSPTHESNAQSLPVTSLIHLPLSLPQTCDPLTSLGASRHLANFQQANNSLSFFSNSILGSKPVLPVPQPQTQQTEGFPPTEMSDSISVRSSVDWQAAFGFKHNEKHSEDDLEFDPCAESFKGLADLMEKENENGRHYGLNHSLAQDQHVYPSHMPQPLPGSLPAASAPSQHSLPPGFSLSHIQHQHQQQFQQDFYRQEMRGSRMMDFMPPFGARPRFPPAMHNNFHHGVPEMTSSGPLHHPSVSQPNNLSSQSDAYNVQGMQDALRSMLPNVNISFGSPPQQLQHPPPPPPPGVSHPQSEAPHWMKSIHQLTECEGPVGTSRLPFAQQFPLSAPASAWPPQMQNPPPGFRNPMRPNSGPTEPHKMAEALQ